MAEIVIFENLDRSRWDFPPRFYIIYIQVFFSKCKIVNIDTVVISFNI